MPFIPNEADAFHADMAELDSVDFDILLASAQDIGVVSGCAVTTNSNMTVAVAAGRVRVAGISVAVTGGNVTITTAHATLPRFDLVVVNNAGTKSVTAGTASANPVYPAIPASSVVLAAVYVPANDTVIAANQITDKRIIIPDFIPATLAANARFVATTGSDSNDGRSELYPKLTIQSAITSLASAPGTIIVGEGTYTLAANTRITPHTGVRIIGVRKGAVTIQAVAGAWTVWLGMISVVSDGTAVSDVHLENLIVDSNSTDTPQLTIGGVDNFSAKSCWFKNATVNAAAGVVISGENNGGFNATTTQGVTFEGCEFGPNAIHGVQFFGANSTAHDVVVLDDVEFDRCYVHDNNWAGISNNMNKYRSIRNVRVLRSKFHDNGLSTGGVTQVGHINDGVRNGWVDLEVAFNWFGAGNATCGGVSDHRGRNIHIHHNTFRVTSATMSTNPIWPLALGDNTIYALADRTWFALIEDNYFEDCGSIDFDGSNDVKFTNNQWYNNNSTCITSFAEHKRCYIDGNIFVNAGRNPPDGNAYRRAAISTGLGVTIRGNAFVDETTKTVADAVLNSTTTVTSATAAFTTTQVGERIDGDGIPGGTTIAARVSATQITLSAAATQTGSGRTLTYGNPDARSMLYGIVEITGDTYSTSIVYSDNEFTNIGTPLFVAVSYNTKRRVYDTGYMVENVAGYGSSVTIANSTTETEVIKLPLPAGWVMDGTTFDFEVFGIISNGATTPTVTWRWRAGNITANIISTVGQVLAVSQTNKGFTLRGQCTIWTTGASGTVIGQMSVVGAHTTTLADAVRVSGQTATVVINTTISRDLVLSAQWSAAAAANTLSVTNRRMSLVKM